MRRFWKMTISAAFIGLSFLPAGSGAARASNEGSVALLNRANRSSENPATFLVRNVRVFDGERIIKADSVLVENGKIARVGQALSAPPEVPVVDGRGGTLLPGLIDAHVHVPNDVEDGLRQAIAFGVTTVIDMSTIPESLKKIKSIEAEDRPDLADVRTAGICATVPGGHPTEMGGPAIPTLTEPGQAAVFIDARVAEGAEFIKIIYDDYRCLESPTILLPTFKPETMGALVDAAHSRGKLAVVHILNEEQARRAIVLGIDGLAHLFIGPVASEDFGKFAAANHVFVIPTLTTLYPMCGKPDGPSVLADDRLRPYIRPEARRWLTMNIWPSLAGKELSCAGTKAGMRQLIKERVPILAGTDSPTPGSALGASLHGELALLVGAGMTPAQALAAATSAPARTFRLADRGLIRAGLRADMVLVKGDPTRDILSTRDIAAIWKRGIPVERPEFPEQ